MNETELTNTIRRVCETPVSVENGNGKATISIASIINNWNITFEDLAAVASMLLAITNGSFMVTSADGAHKELDTTFTAVAKSN